MRVNGITESLVVCTHLYSDVYSIRERVSRTIFSITQLGICYYVRILPSTVRCPSAFRSTPRVSIKKQHPEQSFTPLLKRIGSKPSKAKRRSITVATKTTNIPIVSKPPQESRIPNEIIDEILNHLVADSNFGNDSLQKSPRSCSLVSILSWVSSCRRHLFHTITFTSRNVAKWFEAFPVPEESPAYHVKDLRFSLGGRYGAPEEFFKHTPWFTNAEKMTVTGNVMFPSLGIPLFARLPQSATSLARLTLCRCEISCIMVHLPNLNDLVLSGTVVVRFRKLLLGSGTVLMGRFDCESGMIS